MIEIAAVLFTVFNIYIIWQNTIRIKDKGAGNLDNILQCKKDAGTK